MQRLHLSKLGRFPARPEAALEPVAGRFWPVIAADARTIAGRHAGTSAHAGFAPDALKRRFTADRARAWAWAWAWAPKAVASDSICRYAPNACPQRASSPQSAAPTTAITKPWPTNVRVQGRGRPARGTWRRVIAVKHRTPEEAGGFNSGRLLERSGHPANRNPPRRKPAPWSRNQRQSASGEPGAVSFVVQNAGSTAIRTGCRHRCETGRHFRMI